MTNTHIAIKRTNRVSLSDLSLLEGEFVFTIDTNEIFIGTKNGFVQIQPPKEKLNKQLRPHICERCGAPMHSNICDYCRTEYC